MSLMSRKMACVLKSMIFEAVCHTKSHEILKKMTLIMSFKMLSNQLEICYTNTTLTTKSRLRAFSLHKQSRLKNNFAKIRPYKGGSTSFCLNTANDGKREVLLSDVRYLSGDG